MAGFVLRIVLTLLMMVKAVSAQRPGNFKIVGPGGGGAMFHPQVSPHDPNTVLVACDMTGAYISHDGGKSWRMFNLRGVTEFFVFDPSDKNVIYAKGNGLWRSQDNGETWKLIYPKPSAVKGVKMSSDHSDEYLIADPDPLENISAMAIDPANPKMFYAAAGSRAKGTFGLFTSPDGGESWTNRNDLPSFALKVFLNSASSGAQKTVVAAGSDFIEIENSSGAKSIPVPPGKKITDISVGFSANGTPVFYIIDDESAFVSDDSGASWRKVQFGEGKIKLRAIATSLRHPETAYVSYRDLEDGGLKYMGVAKTTDAGHSWIPVWKEDSNKDGKSGANIHDAWITETFGSDWGENPLTLYVADQDPNLAYATDLGRTMKTADGGFVPWTCSQTDLVATDWELVA